MTVKDLEAKLNLKALNEATDTEVEGAFISDMLSDVMAGAKAGNVWVTLQTHKNTIAAANGIVNPSLVYVGQKLTIPQGSVSSPGTGVRYHVVQSGESLSSIALRYGTTPWKIAAANGISNINWIYAGRTLRIP